MVTSGDRHPNHTWTVTVAQSLPGRCLDPDGVGGDELAPHGDRPEDDLQAVEEVLANNYNGLTAGGPSLAGRHRLDLRHQGVWI
jgi:hypothetical protein